jgi:hypothetical protein
VIDDSTESSASKSVSVSVCRRCRVSLLECSWSACREGTLAHESESDILTKSPSFWLLEHRPNTDQLSCHRAILTC